MSDEEPLSPNEANLAHLANRHGPDLFLTELVQRAELSAGLGVALLVNGMIIMGSLASPMRMAEEIDAEWLGAFDLAGRPEDLSEEEWAEMREKVSKRQADSVREQLDALEKLGEDAEPYAESGGTDALAVPAELGRRLIHGNTVSHLTVKDAHIFAPGQQGMTAVDVMRVAIDQVGGWWLLRTDGEGRNVSVLWRTDGGPSQGGDLPQPSE